MHMLMWSRFIVCLVHFVMLISVKMWGSDMFETWFKILVKLVCTDRNLQVQPNIKNETIRLVLLIIKFSIIF